jgi:hypothetical protein
LFHEAGLAPQVMYRLGPEERLVHLLRIVVMPPLSAVGIDLGSGEDWSVLGEYSLVPIPPFPFELFARAGCTVLNNSSQAATYPPSLTSIRHRGRLLTISVGAQVGLGLWVVRQVGEYR